MNRSTIAKGLVVLVAGALIGGTTVAVATPSDPCEASYVKPMNSTDKLRKYVDCREDRQDAALKRIEAELGTTPTTTPSPSATPSQTPSVTPSASPSVSVTPSATPSPSASLSATQTPEPSATETAVPTGKPGPTNTGVPAGTTLTAYTGPMTITTAGTVIDSKDIKGSLIIKAKNVVIRNSKIHDDMSATAGVDVQDTGSLTISDSELYNFDVAIVYANWTGVRLNIHDIAFDGIKMSSNATLRDSWIHAPKPTADAHWDGIQVQNGVVNTVIAGNVIDAGDQKVVDTNSALFLVPDLDASTDGPLTVTGNWLNGGNYTVYCLDGRDGQTIKQITISDNRFGNDFKYGRSYVNVPITQSGNVIDSTGAAYTL